MVETVSSLPLIIKKSGLNTIPTHQYTVEPLYSGHLGDRRKWPLLKQEWMYGLSAQKNSRFREVAVSGGSTVDFIGLLAQGHFINAHVFSSQLFLMVPTEQIQTPSFLAWWIPVVYSLQRCLLFPERRVLLFIATVAGGLDLESIFTFLARLMLIIAQLTWITHISCLQDRMLSPS